MDDVTRTQAGITKTAGSAAKKRVPASSVGDQPTLSVPTGEVAALSTLTSVIPEIPGYVLEKRLGEGGMGVVFHGRQLKLNREVAIKMLHGGSAVGAKELIRFMAEAEAVAAVDHPNVVRVYESGTVSSRPYIAMEYLPGGSLYEKLHDGGPMDPKDAVTLVRKLALALQAAHDEQIVHRDLKPANVLFDSHDEPRVTDFGLAKKGASELTATQAVMGTPNYMAPEQARGESKFVGPSADVWALGVILFECLTGERPFHGENEIETIRNVAEKDAPKMRSFNSEVPKELELVVRKCLQKEPEKRYASARAFAADLKRWLKGEPLSVKPPKLLERIHRWGKRNKLGASIITVSILGLVAMTILLVDLLQSKRETLLAKIEAEKATTNAEQERDDARRAKADALAKSVQIRHMLDVRTLSVASEAARDGNDTRYRESIAKLSDEARKSNVFKMLNHCFQRGAVPHAVTIDSFQESTRLSFGWNLDGTRIVACGGKAGVAMFDLTTGTKPETFTIELSDGTIRDALIGALNARGDQYVVGDNIGNFDFFPWGNNIRGDNYNIGNDSAGAGDLLPRAAAFSPDNRYLAAACISGTVMIIETATKTRVKIFEDPNRNGVASLSWGPSTLVVGYSDGTIRYFNAPGFEAQDLGSRHNSSVSAVAVSRDGKTLASGGADSRILFWDLAGYKPLPDELNHGSPVHSLSWSPDGSAVIAAGEKDNARVYDYDARLLIFELPRTEGIPPGSTALWSPSRNAIALGHGNRIAIWNADR